MEIVKLHIKSAAQDTAKPMSERVSKALDKALALGKSLDGTRSLDKRALGLFILKEMFSKRAWGDVPGEKAHTVL